MLTHTAGAPLYRATMEIGDRIRKARTVAGMSQTELANACEVSRGLVAQWETHRKKPGRDNVMALARATTVSVPFILGQEPIDRLTITVSDRDEIALLRLYRRLSLAQKKNLSQLVGAAVQVRQEIEQQSAPADKERIDP